MCCCCACVCRFFHFWNLPHSEAVQRKRMKWNVDGKQQLHFFSPSCERDQLWTPHAVRCFVYPSITRKHPSRPLTLALMFLRPTIAGIPSLRAADSWRCLFEFSIVPTVQVYFEVLVRPVSYLMTFRGYVVLSHKFIKKVLFHHLEHMFFDVNATFVQKLV